MPADAPGPLTVRSCLSVPGARHRGTLLRAGWLTPYVAETIVRDALRAGPGARLELTVGVGASAADLARVQNRFAWLEAGGIDLHVERDGRAAPRWRDAAA